MVGDNPEAGVCRVGSENDEAEITGPVSEGLRIFDGPPAGGG
ncbi:MAG: hypothetical protein ACLSHO_09580 [Dysosmobacter sp.]